MDRINNKKINKDEGYVLISINPKIYPLDVVYAAGYVLMDKAYILIDGDPEEEIIVELSPKNKDGDLNVLANEFNNELLNYATYKVQSDRNRGIKQAILQRVLLTNVGVKGVGKPQEDNFLDDPEEIMCPHKEDE